MKPKIFQLCDIIKLLKENTNLSVDPNPVYENDKFKRYRICVNCADGTDVGPLIFLKDVELAYPVRPAYGEHDRNTCRDISMRLTDEMLEFGQLLQSFAASRKMSDFSRGADAYTPMKEHCMNFRLNKRGNKNLITRVSEVITAAEDGKKTEYKIDVQYNPGIMTELFNVSGITIDMLFFRMEVTVTKETCSLALVAEKIYADFSTRDSLVNENQMDDMFKQVAAADI